jgi:hypothetical protein
MSDIFIAYAKEDRSKVRKIADGLEAQGWSVFWDRVIPAGKIWRTIIETELSECHCVVVVWSKTSTNSHWVVEEAEIARQRGILIPVLIEEVLPPLGFRILQAADLSHWDGSSTATVFRNLVTDIARTLHSPSDVEKKQQNEEIQRKIERVEEVWIKTKERTTTEELKENNVRKGIERLDFDDKEPHLFTGTGIQRVIAGATWGSLVVGIQGAIIGRFVQNVDNKIWGLANGIFFGIIVGAISSLVTMIMSFPTTKLVSAITWGVITGTLGGVIMGQISGPIVFGTGGWLPMTISAVLIGSIVGGIVGIAICRLRHSSLWIPHSKESKSS